MSTNVNNYKPSNNFYSPSDMAFHPIRRGIGAGLLTSLFTTGTYCSFSTGFIFGGISGVANLALRPLNRFMFARTTSPEGKAATYFFGEFMPWAIAAGVLRRAYKATGNHLFRINPAASVATAVCMQVFSRFNEDLLKTPDSKNKTK